MSMCRTGWIVSCVFAAGFIVVRYSKLKYEIDFIYFPQKSFMVFVHYVNLQQKII